MRNWNEDNPKAALMARKRVAILDAARVGFLETGFAGTSMESVAVRAGVSIMTLYRHARTKRELFEAVITEACRPAVGSQEEAAIEAVLRQPLVEVLTFFGDRFQERLLTNESLNLLRIVIHEQSIFPDLPAVAYEGLIGRHVRELAAFLLDNPQGEVWSPEQCKEASWIFADRLGGAPVLAALMGLPDVAGERYGRSRVTAEEVLRFLRRSKTQQLD